MADYHRMYTHLFNTITEMVNILQKAQQATEEMFVESQEAAIKLAEPSEQSPCP